VFRLWDIGKGFVSEGRENLSMFEASNVVGVRGAI
jgi:hypothetical protein